MSRLTDFLISLESHTPKKILKADTGVQEAMASRYMAMKIVTLSDFLKQTL